MGVHFERARVLYRQARYAQAERELRDELAEHPHWGQAHSFLGRCIARQNRLPEALEACEEGVRLAPELPYAHYMLGLTLLDMERLAKAEEALREALRLDPRDPDLYEWLSWVQYQRGDKQGAAVTAQQGLAINPEHIGCLNRLGFFLRWLGEHRRSEEPLRAALKLDPENAYTHTNLAWTLYGDVYKRIAQLGGAAALLTLPLYPRLREAHRHFLEALRLDPTSDWAKTGAAETTLFRYRALVQFALLPLFLAVFLLFAGAVPVKLPTAGAPPQPFVVGMLLLIGGGVTVLFANGPVYAAMLRDRLAPALLSPGRRLAAKLTLGCLAVAAVAAVVAAFAPPPAAFAVFFVACALIRPLTAACEATPVAVQRVMAVYTCVLAAAGLGLTIYITLADAKDQASGAVMLLVGGLFGSLFARSIAQDAAKRCAKKT